jgi:hypothetical protein
MHRPACLGRRLGDGDRERRADRIRRLTCTTMPRPKNVLGRATVRSMN